MWSAEEISAVKVAVALCNNPLLKSEVLCVPGSEYDAKKKDDPEDCKKEWDEIVEKTAGEMLNCLVSSKELVFSEKLKNKLLGIILLVGMRMLTWAKYHEGILGFSREYSFNFLSASFFTSRGIVDSKEAAEHLMKDESLSTEQKYKLACLYCFTEFIPALYKSMSKESRASFYDASFPGSISQPQFIKFWTYYLMGDIDQLKGEKCLDQYRLEKAVESGNKTAVEYCLEKKNFKRKTIVLLYAAVESIRNRIRSTDDWVIFRSAKASHRWVPRDYYVDILYFLLCKMRRDQQIELLKRDIEGVVYERPLNLNPGREYPRHSRALECFLDWPYQSHFLGILEIVFEFLPTLGYTNLLFKICGKIESEKGDMRYGEERSFNYRQLLKEVWGRSPEYYKMYVLDDKKNRKNRDKVLKDGKELLFKLFALESFTYEDKKIIWMMLDNAFDYQKEDIILSENGKNICIELMKKEMWDTLEEFLSNCLLSEEKVNEFKRNLSGSGKAGSIYISFVENRKFDAAECFIKSLSINDVSKFRKVVFSSWKIKEACSRLMEKEKWEGLDEFLSHFSPNSEELQEFRRKFCLSWEAQKIYTCFALSNNWIAAEFFVKWSTLSQNEISEFMKKVYSSSNVQDACGRLMKEEKWERLDEFISHFLPNPEELQEFRRKFCLSWEAQKIYICFALSNNWKAAEFFINWSTLSQNEISEFMKKVYSSLDIVDACCRLMKEGKWDCLDEFLSKCLPFKEQVDEFKMQFSITREVQDMCIRSILSRNFDAVESFIKWSGLPENKIKELMNKVLFHWQLKNFYRDMMREEEWERVDEMLSKCLPVRELFYEFKREFSDTVEAQNLCCGFIKRDKSKAVDSNIKNNASSDVTFKQSLFSETENDIGVIPTPSDKFIAVDKFIAWCSISSLEEVKEFKKKLLFSKSGMWTCVNFLLSGDIELANEFACWSLTWESEKRELKEVAEEGWWIFKELLTEEDENLRITAWEDIEIVLTWCFSSELDIDNFKRECLIQKRRDDFLIEVHRSLMANYKWYEAELFFAWLGLSSEEIRALKKETILLPSVLKGIRDGIYGSGDFPDCEGGDWESMELYLRWCLMDEEAVAEFKDKFYELNEMEEEEDDCDFANFLELIEELRNDVSKKAGNSKRKLEALEEFPNKKICAEKGQCITSE